MAAQKKKKEESRPEWSIPEKGGKKKADEPLSQDWGHSKRPRRGLTEMTPAGAKGRRCKRATVNKDFVVDALLSFNKLFEK